MKISINKISLFLLALTLITFSACQNENEKKKSHAESDVKQTNERFTGEKQELPGTSVYHLDNRWANQDGDSIKLKSLYGKPFVMAMIYTHCPYACPRIIGDMKAIEKEIPDQYKKDINFLLVSIDPEQDTPDTLKAFMQEKNLDPGRWTGIVSNKDDIQELAAAIGFNYKKTSAMDFAHSNLITVFDKQGVQIHQTEGFNADKKETVNKLVSEAKDIQDPSQ